MSLRATLDLPGGPTRGRAIVLMHGCGGVSRRDTQWADLPTRAGHVVLAPDSYGARGLGPQCRAAALAEVPRWLDALSPQP